MPSPLRAGLAIATVARLCAQAFGAPCEDQGPWPCSEDGCPAPMVTCAMLKGECNSLFKSVWKEPPTGLGGEHVWRRCPRTCARCEEAVTEAVKGKCVAWR